MSLDSAFPPGATDQTAGAAPHSPDLDEGLACDAVVFEGARRLSLRRLTLERPGPDDVMVDVLWSGISTGTERLLWTGEMPPFPGLSYPLVPGYEAVGVIAESPGEPGRVGELVFVPGSKAFREAAGLFGASASRVVVPAARVTRLPDGLGAEGALLALAATAYHAIVRGAAPPQLVIGHGVLGRLVARITRAMGHPAPTVWETNPVRRDSSDYPVIDGQDDPRRDYASICDVSGSLAVIDEAIARLSPRGELVLAGFYTDRPSFAFPPAFMREAAFLVAAEWSADDLAAVLGLIGTGALRLDGLITHRVAAAEAQAAYDTAFQDAACLKLVLDWRAST